MKIRRKAVGLTIAAIMAITATVQAAAATATYTFETVGDVYGITTTCTDFSNYVTAYAKVENNGAYTQTNSRGYQNAATTARRTCTSGTVTRTGWYTT